MIFPWGAREQIFLQWAFVAKTIKEHDTWIYDTGSEGVELSERGKVSLEKSARPISASEHRYVALGEHDKSGSKPSGYVVRVLNGEEIVKVAGSSSKLIAIAKSPEKWRKLVTPSE